MRNSQLALLIANMFLVGGFLAHSFFTSFGMILVAFLWLINSLISAKREYSIYLLEKKLEIIDNFCKKRGRKAK